MGRSVEWKKQQEKEIATLEVLMETVFRTASEVLNERLKINLMNVDHHISF
jgi:hypothetical protein